MKLKLFVLLLTGFFFTSCYTSGFIVVENTPTKRATIHSSSIDYLNVHWLQYHYYYAPHHCTYYGHYNPIYYNYPTNKRNYKKRNTSLTYEKRQGSVRTNRSRGTIERTPKRTVRKTRSSGTRKRNN